MIRPVPGIWWGVDILAGRREFPTFQKERKGEGFKEVLDKEMEKNERVRGTQTDRQHL